MLYILAGITGIGLLACAVELLGRVADRIGITDRLFRLFDLPEDEPKSNVIYVDFQNAQKERNA
ncbi:MAG TPA: hypothetical protein IAA38_08240 [Candidatus Ruminococcus gallistercoris]|nr:hypothetical protein [Candidatus Ruminococcus gallistercoris]